jgi:hypothetical protein
MLGVTERASGRTGPAVWYPMVMGTYQEGLWAMV